jgi:hypothetical protein
MHVIFLLHGMGNSNTGWAEKAKALIKKHYDKSAYAFLDGWPFDATFKFHELNYNPIFDRYLDEAKKQSEKLGDWDKFLRRDNGALRDVLSRIVGLAKQPPNRDNFLVTHVADVALFMATDLGELVKARVAEQIAARLTADGFKAGTDRWSIIAHSLGTRVATEVLQVGFSAAPSLRNFGKARVLMMASNTSRLLQDLSPFNAGDVYKNEVYPGRGAAGCCHHYINATHRLDPFAFINEFDPPADFGNGRAFLDDAYHPVKLSVSDITAKDIHSLEHYLEHPEVHTTLYRYLLPGNGKAGPTAAELKQAMTAYQEKTLAADITNGWRESLAALKKEPFGGLADIYALWEKYGALLP